MRILRVLSLSVAALLMALATVLFVGTLLAGRHTLKHDAEIKSAFLRAASWVDAFKRDNQRIPSAEELRAWSAAQKESFWLKSIELTSDTSGLTNEARKSFGVAPAGTYVLGLWRGEWSEYFASWTRTSTVDNTRGRIMAIALQLALSVAVFVAGFLLWRFGRGIRQWRPT